jgi:DNA-binding response OmpR family regulator
VFDAPDGRLGLQVFEREHPDLVVTDVIMPEVEGHEVLLKLRKKVPLIAMSGGLRQSAEDLLHVASLLGAARVLQKPFGTAALIHAIDELLPQSVQDEAAVSSG